jgi:hypothetical protein
MPEYPNPASQKNLLLQPKDPPLSYSDSFAIKNFVQNTLAAPPQALQTHLPLHQLIEQNPSLYAAGVELLSQGLSPTAVSAATSLPLQTTRAISHFIPDYRSVVRSATARNLSQASLRLSEILAEKADQMPLDRIPFALAVTTDKGELLSGGVTARTEHRNIPTPEELQAMFNALPKANATVIEDPA